MTYLLDPSSHRISQWLQEQGEPAFRFRQIWRWLAVGRATCFSEMTDLPASLREKLDDVIPVWETTVLAHQKSEDGSEKLLLEFSSGGQAECVLLRDGDRRTVCISSQVGCAMGCVFCASGLDGVDRDLTAGEIIEQMIRLQHCLPDEERISHIVMMGMGEPLANLDNVLSALESSGDPEGLCREALASLLAALSCRREMVWLNEYDTEFPSRGYFGPSLVDPDARLRLAMTRAPRPRLASRSLKTTARPGRNSSPWGIGAASWSWARWPG